MREGGLKCKFDLDHAIPIIPKCGEYQNDVKEPACMKAAY